MSENIQKSNKPNCHGCHGYNYYDKYANMMECDYTFKGVYIPDCICSDCLIKSICSNVCVQLKKMREDINK